MTALSVSKEDKAEFKELKPDGMSQKEFFKEVLQGYKESEGERVDVDELAEEIKKSVASEIELAAYRGIDDYFDKNIK